MTLSGSAFLALWNDVFESRETEYNRWHTQEHVPERVGIAGFISGRRYCSERSGQRRYFTLYDVNTPAVFESSAYLDVIDFPTAWSAAMRPTLCNVVRMVCDRFASEGEVSGDAILCVRLVLGAALDDAAAQQAYRNLVAVCMALDGVDAVHFGLARSSVPPAFEKWTNAQEPTHLLMLEGASQLRLLQHAAAIEHYLLQNFMLKCAIGLDTYDLVFSIRHTDVDQALAARNR